MPTADQPQSARPPVSSHPLGAAPSRNGHLTGEPQTFRSLLFGSSEADPGVGELKEPECFGDLNLDQLVALVVARAALRKAQLRVASASSTFTPRVNMNGQGYWRVL